MGMTNSEYVGFWTWFFQGTGSRPGAFRLLSLWIVLDIIIGILIAFYMVKIDDFSSVLIPTISLVFGLVITCVFGSVSIYSSINLFNMSQHHAGGYFDFIYPYYMTILMSLCITVFWMMLYVMIDINEQSNLIYVRIGSSERLLNIWLCLGVSLVSFLIRTVWRTLLGVPMQVFFNLKVQEVENSKS